MSYLIKEEAAQYIIDDKGKPKAVILSMKEYEKILSLLSELMDRREGKILSQSKEFKKLVRKGLKEIKEGKVKNWKEVWDEL